MKIGKTRQFKEYISSHEGEARPARRTAARYRRRNRKSYFILPREVISLYKTRSISAIDVRVYAFLCSLRREYDGVRVSQYRIANACETTEKTVSESTDRLYKCGLIARKYENTDNVKNKSKYKKNIYIYVLKPLSKSGFFFCQRGIFRYTMVKHKMFAIYLFMCLAHSFEYGKSWNSYNDICERLGFGKCSRSEIVKLIGELARRGLIKKTVRRIRKSFVDNIYRVTGFEEAVTQQHYTWEPLRLEASKFAVQCVYFDYLAYSPPLVYTQGVFENLEGFPF